MCSLAFLATLWLAASIVTYKLGLAVEWGFLQLHVQSVILHQRHQQQMFTSTTVLQKPTT